MDHTKNQTNEGKQYGKSLYIKGYLTDKILCAVSHMTEYLDRTKPLRSSQQLFIMLNHTSLYHKTRCLYG